jgi:PAS domain S-box-containing protein
MAFQRLFGRYSLSVVITTVFVALLTVMACVTWLLTFRNGQASIRELADQFGRQSMANIRQHLASYVAAPRLVNDLNTYPFSAGPGMASSQDDLARRLAAELREFDSVISIAYGNERGEYVGISRELDGMPLTLAISDDSTARYLAAYRSNSQGSRLEEFRRSSVPFDARLRPWFTAAVAAGGAVWTPVYLWLSGDAGVDIVTPVHDSSGRFKGVLDTSLTLTGIGRFLKSIRATPHSEGFIMEGSGLLVASSATAAPYTRSGDALVRIEAAKSDTPFVRAGAQEIMAEIGAGEAFNDQKQFTLSFGRERHVMLVDRFRDGPGLDWYFAEVIPESDFAQQIYHDMRSTAVFVAIFLLASMIIALILARGIAAPLRQLTRMARGLAKGDLSSTIDVRGTDEVGQLAESFNVMAGELEKSFGSLAESEGRYRAFVSSSAAGIFRFEAREPMPVSLSVDEQVEWFYRSFYLAECNDTASNMFGFRTMDGLIGTGPEIWLPRDDPASLDYLRQMIRSSSRVPSAECTRRDGQGTLRSLLTSVSGVVESGRVVRIWGVFRDITERRVAEEALRQSESKFRSIFHRSAVSLWEADTSELRAALDSLEARGVTDLEGFMRDNPPFVSESLRMIRIVDVNETTLRLFEAGSREELLGPLSIAFDPAALSSLVPAAIAHAESGRQHDIETKVMTRSGKPLNVIIHFYIPAENDALTNMLVSVVDITKRTQAEAERAVLQEELRQAQKVETIGRLAGGISHDINNLLTPILGGCELLLMDPALEGQKDTAEQILGAARRIGELTRKLLAFSRKQQLSMQVVNLGSVICEFQKLLRRTIRGNVDIRVVNLDDTGPVRVDVGQIEQVLMNLAVNAQDAMPDGGALTIDLRNAALDEEAARAHPGMNPGNYVVLSVTDTGTGIDEADREHIFEPFFTTKDVGRGTGLGLSTVYGIVKQHGGSICVDSEPGWGTAFRIFLPWFAPEAFAPEAD